MCSRHCTYWVTCYFIFPSCPTSAKTSLVLLPYHYISVVCPSPTIPLPPAPITPPPVSSLPSSATFPALIPMISMAGCSYHCLDRKIPSDRSAAKHKSMIGWVAVYCATVFWWQEIYTPISSIPTISNADPIGGYTHFLSS